MIWKLMFTQSSSTSDFKNLFMYKLFHTDTAFSYFDCWYLIAFSKLMIPSIRLTSFVHIAQSLIIVSSFNGICIFTLCYQLVAIVKQHIEDIPPLLRRQIQIIFSLFHTKTTSALIVSVTASHRAFILPPHSIWLSAFRFFGLFNSLY